MCYKSPVISPLDLHILNIGPIVSLINKTGYQLKSVTGGIRSPYSFLVIKKNCPNLEKSALTVLIYCLDFKFTVLF